MFAIGTLIEHKNEKLKELLGYLFISVIVSIGTGMVSGATQHYVDKPSVGAILLSVGLLVSYISFTWRDYSAQLNTKRVIVAILAAVVLWFGLGIINSILPEREHAVDHHSIN